MIEVENLTIRSGAFVATRLALHIEGGKYGVLMGKTGCGKTTLLEAVCGLRPVLEGSIRLCGRDVTRLRPAERQVGYVPQDLALFPTMTVGEHLAFALRVRRVSVAETTRRVSATAEMLGITHLLERMPQGLSGGEAQRVALGRALAFQPQVLLLDEPLSALDEDTRQEMYKLLHDLQRRTGVTTLHVTHSRSEARALADQLFRFEGGAVQEQTLDLPE